MQVAVGGGDSDGECSGMARAGMGMVGVLGLAASGQVKSSHVVTILHVGNSAALADGNRMCAGGCTVPTGGSKLTIGGRGQTRQSRVHTGGNEARHGGGCGRGGAGATAAGSVGAADALQLSAAQRDVRPTPLARVPEQIWCPGTVSRHVGGSTALPGGNCMHTSGRATPRGGR
jgi:hypothetical protein